MGLELFEGSSSWGDLEEMAGGGIWTFWGTIVIKIGKKHDFGGLFWKRIKLTSSRKANAKKRLHRDWQVLILFITSPLFPVVKVYIFFYRFYPFWLIVSMLKLFYAKPFFFLGFSRLIDLVSCWKLLRIHGKI